MTLRVQDIRRWWRARLVLAVLACLALCGGAALVAVGLSAAGQPAAAPLPSPGPELSAPAAPSAGAARGKSGAGSVRGPRAAAAAGRNARPTWQAGLAAAHIRIPVLGVTASIGTGAVTSAGELDPPRAPGTVGVWPGSAGLDARAGEVTLAGHVNWAGMGPFAFGGLAYLMPGDLAYTAGAGGRQTAWRVTDVFALRKGQPLDPSAFAGPAGPRRLALITCGGAYDPATGSYADNVYVLATPVWRDR